ncbi:CLUMA_CG012666, isoform A [Clunio marinus]|uniref:CLUMA_CG012666, isoform A n=1 Tax=Clunio marinus TaxID=568069 RepID=A0A1J1IGN4_9DIPT|nr:CLUMA_CG012666, isoform A [Clunio marinus]
MMSESTPICRCRVLYLGSAVPRQSKDGLQGIQEPLRSLYPIEGAGEAKGIDSWLSVWSNGILLENVDENRKQVTRFFPIESLHYCAAVRQVLIPERSNAHPEPKFLPLDSPFARTPRVQHPPIFAAILRRTTGIKVLECHTFICKREAAANALVRCCFHAYADNSYAKQIENGISVPGSLYGTLGGKSSMTNGDTNGWRSRAGSTATLNSTGRHNQTNGNGIGDAYTVKNLYASSGDLDVTDDGESSFYNNGDENHKIWNGSHEQLNGINGHKNGDTHYDFYSSGINGSSTLGRPSRQRQISAPIPVPPPPKEEIKKKKKENKRNSSSKSVGSQSMSGTLIRPRPIHPSGRGPPPPHHIMMYGPPPPPHMMGPPMNPPHPMHMGPPPQMNGRQFHTIGHRVKPHQPPHMIPMHMQPIPIMLPPQYATLQSVKGKKKKGKDKMNGAIPVGMPIPPPMFYPPPPASLIESPRTMNMSNRKLAQSTAALDDSGNSGAESPGETGIYRRKGHLNERAFSYSIRQEHRSRSHGSLSSLQFNPPDMKKEREIIQMVSGLELNDDSTLRRSREMSASSTGTFGKLRR